MHLEWSVILTQAVGFIVVLLILKKFAWGKLLGFIDQRREKIAGEFADIERGHEEVDHLKADLEKQLARIEETRREKIQEAGKLAGKLADDIKDDARKDVMVLREKAGQDIKMELDKANVQLRDQMVNAVITATEKLIKERLDSEKQRQLISDFLADVGSGDGQ